MPDVSEAGGFDLLNLWPPFGRKGSRATVTIEGKTETQGRHGVKLEDTRAIHAKLTEGDASVNYVFDEGEIR